MRTFFTWILQSFIILAVVAALVFGVVTVTRIVDRPFHLHEREIENGTFVYDALTGEVGVIVDFDKYDGLYEVRVFEGVPPNAKELTESKHIREELVVFTDDAGQPLTTQHLQSPSLDLKRLLVPAKRSREE